MSTPHAFAAALLESSLSANSAGIVLELRTALGNGACAQAGRFEDLTADARQRLRYLIEAVALDCPGIYVDHLQWQRATHAARGLAPRVLASALAGQRSVLAQGLPPAAFATLEPFLAAGEAALTFARVEGPRAIDGPGGAPVAQLLACALSGKRGDFLDLGRRLVQDVGEEVFVETLLAGTLDELGRMWQQGEIHIGEEHLVSRQVEDALAQLPAWSPRPPRLGRRAMIAAPGGDLHELGARMLATCFERNGWDVFLLGANVPATDLARSAQELGPEVVLLSVSQGLFVRGAAESIAALRATSPRVFVVVGGAPFRSHPELARTVGADATAGCASEAERLARAERSPRP